MSGFNVTEIIQLLLPLLVLELALKVFALVKLSKAPVKHLPKWAWVLIIILVSTFGSISFLLFGASPYGDDAANGGGSRGKDA